MKRLFLIAILFSINFCANAQINKVSIQASGLTCSMCSNAINKALKSIDYVDHVIANIKNSTFEIYFK
jgi:copper chaperone CopZ